MLKDLILWSVAAGTIVVAGIAFYRYEVGLDYAVVAEVECDPEQESCFVGAYEGEAYFYKIVTKPAGSIPACNAWADECEDLACEEGEEGCVARYCDPALDTCSGPRNTH